MYYYVPVNRNNLNFINPETFINPNCKKMHEGRFETFENVPQYSQSILIKHNQRGYRAGKSRHVYCFMLFPLC